MADKFILKSPYTMTGDQPEAVLRLTEGINAGKKHQTLLGVTGSGKTFTMANVIANVNKPTLVISHNKTLAAQLCGEFKEFFPDNAVEYFISYYDYYQPEAYVPSTDTYIEKDSDVNEEIDRLRYSATASLFERRDVIIVASVSCIYGLGSPDEYNKQMISLRPGMKKNRDEIIRNLVDIQYSRNDIDFARGTFRVRGDIIDVIPAGGEHAIRIEMFGDEIDSIKEIDQLTGEVIAKRSHVAIFPASHYVTSKDKMEKALISIEEELEDRIRYFKDRGKLLEAQRIEQRTRYDIEMLREIGTCKGIENYSRHLIGNKEGDKPFTLLDYFPDDFLIIVDESHAMIPQLRAMANGDKARKTSLVDYGFRLPSALDNRPLRFEEFEEKVNQIIYVSATPADYEKEKAEGISAQQLIRPTGLLDPEIEVVKTEGQIDHLIGEINKEIKKGNRVLVTTLTKKMAESLTGYLKNLGISCNYMHSDIDTLERNEILRDLRLGKFDVLVGINLLREGLDLPEVSLVAILDADKEGFLRTETSLIQTVGRASRNANGRVIMYADSISPAMKACIDETKRRRAIQNDYNLKHGITPKTIEKSIRDVLEVTTKINTNKDDLDNKNLLEFTKKELKEYAQSLEKRMKEAAKNLDFEQAALLRDRMLDVKARI